MGNVEAGPIAMPIDEKATEEATNQLLHTMHILGPTTLTLYRIKVLTKAFAFFGERHDVIPRCPPILISSGYRAQSMPIQTYLQTLARAYPAKPLDIFLESEYVSKLETKSEAVSLVTQLAALPRKDIVDLGTLLVSWRSCLTTDKSGCSLPKNVRVHYIDLRHHPVLRPLMLVVDANKADPLRELIGLGDQLSGFTPPTQANPEPGPVLDRGLVIQSETKKQQDTLARAAAAGPPYIFLFQQCYRFIATVFVEIGQVWMRAIQAYGEGTLRNLGIIEGPRAYLNRLLGQVVKIKKQVAAISNPLVRTEIIAYWNRNVEQICDRLDTVLRSNEIFANDRGEAESKTLGPTPVSLIANWPNVRNLMEAISLFYDVVRPALMDSYGLARMFRRFHDYEASYILFYGGEYHAVRYRDFIRRLEVVSKDSFPTRTVSDVGNKCLPTKDIDWNQYFASF